MEARAHILTHLHIDWDMNYDSTFVKICFCYSSYNSFISIWVNVRNSFGDRPFLEMMSVQVTHCIIPTKTRTLKLKGCHYEYFAISDTTHQDTLRCSQRPRSICRDYVSVTGVYYTEITEIYSQSTHIMMTSWYGNISALLALCEGNPSITSGFPL